MQNYADMIKRSGLKATFQRMTILSTIDKMGHSSIEEIYKEVKKNHPTLSLATVYKNILNMVNHNVLHELPIVGQKSKYELSKGEHIHLICMECNSIVDISIDNLTIYGLQELYGSLNFTNSTTQINIYGLCGSCKLQ